MHSQMFLGIDVGTGGTRAVIIDVSGKVIGAATGEHAPFASPQTGWAEQDPADWWRASQFAVQNAIRAANISSDQIACVGLTGQMHGAVLLDDRGRSPSAFDHLVRSTHRRSVPLADRQNRRRPADRTYLQSCPDKFHAYRSSSGFASTSRRSGSRVKSVLLPKDYVRFRLNGEHAIDVADASGTLMLDVAHRRWSAEVVDSRGNRSGMAAHAVRIHRSQRTYFR